MAFLAARLWRSMLLPKPRSTGCRCKRIPKSAATVEEVGQVATVDLKEEERLVAQLVPLLVAAKLQWLDRTDFWTCGQGVASCQETHALSAAVILHR